MLNFLKGFARRITGISTPFGGVQWKSQQELAIEINEKKVYWLRKLEASYPNIFDTDQLSLGIGMEAEYISDMLELERMGFVQSGLIETATGYVISNPRLTAAGKKHLEKIR